MSAESIESINLFMPGPNHTPTNGIYYGDCRELAKHIHDKSIDMIFTDPPYPEGYLWAYGFLAELGARVLKSGKWMFVYGGGEFKPQIYAHMADKGLDFFWEFVLLHHGGYPRLWNKELMNGYKPIYVYTKGWPEINPWMSTVHSDEQDKRYHKWGQGAGFAMKAIEMLTEPGDVVLDPFCGGGTTAAVCKVLGRQYMAFDNDIETVKIARDRLINTNPPLFVLGKPKQNGTNMEFMELLK